MCPFTDNFLLFCILDNSMGVFVVCGAVLKIIRGNCDKINKNYVVYTFKFLMLDHSGSEPFILFI